MLTHGIAPNVFHLSPRRGYTSLDVKIFRPVPLQPVILESAVNGFLKNDDTHLDKRVMGGFLAVLVHLAEGSQIPNSEVEMIRFWLLIS